MYGLYPCIITAPYTLGGAKGDAVNEKSGIASRLARKKKLCLTNNASTLTGNM